MITLRKLQSNKERESGLATLEALPILVVFLVLITYGLGYFGAVHTGILYSIHARTYAFETLRNRANYVYFRDADPKTGGAPTLYDQYRDIGFRVHGIDSDKDRNSGDIVSSTRPITFGQKVESKNAENSEIHNSRIFQLGQARNRSGGVDVNPIWIMVQYGICIDAGCGE